MGLGKSGDFARAKSPLSYFISYIPNVLSNTGILKVSTFESIDTLFKRISKFRLLWWISHYCSILQLFIDLLDIKLRCSVCIHNQESFIHPTWISSGWKWGESKERTFFLGKILWKSKHRDIYRSRWNTEDQEKNWELAIGPFTTFYFTFHFTFHLLF